MSLEFALRDQYDKLLAYHFPRQKAGVLALADKRGAAQIEAWVRSLYDRYQDRIDIHGIAVLTGLPSFARGLVRQFFKQTVEYPVLLDWDGAVSQAYGYQSGQANLLVIDPGSRILLRLAGPASDASLGQVYAELDRLLLRPPSV